MVGEAEPEPYVSSLEQFQTLTSKLLSLLVVSISFPTLLLSRNVNVKVVGIMIVT